MVLDLKSDEAPDERDRLAALYELEILDTPAEQSFDDIVAVAAAACDTPIALLNFIDADRQWNQALIGLSDSEIPRAASLCALTLEQPDGLLVIPDTLADPRTADHPSVVSGLRLRFYAGVAIVTGSGHAVGALCVAGTGQPREPGPRSIDALRGLARQVSVLLTMREETLRVADAYRQLRDLAITDPLTNLVNRTFLEHTLGLALRQRERSGRHLGILFCDLDGLKAVNDNLGHDAGDQLLVQVAARLAAAARAADLVSRFGGDEFVVMCPDLGNRDDLPAIAGRLHDAVGRPVELGDVLMEPGLSVGRALAAAGDDPETLIKRADEDMYRDKRRRQP